MAKARKRAVQFLANPLGAVVSVLASRLVSQDNLPHTVNAARAKSFPRPVARGFAAGLMLFLWLALGMASSSSQLHHLLHRDSHQASHECVLTLLSKGLIAGPESAGPLVAAPVIQEVSATAFSVVASVSSDVRLAPGRAPPGGLVFSPASS